MKCNAEIVIFKSSQCEISSENQNNLEVIDIIEVDVISDRDSSYAVLTDDFVVEMIKSYKN